MLIAVPNFSGAIIDVLKIKDLPEWLEPEKAVKKPWRGLGEGSTGGLRIKREHREGHRLPQTPPRIEGL